MNPEEVKSLVNVLEERDQLRADLEAVKAERDELKANLDEEQARFPLVYADMASARAERDAAIKERDRLRATMETLMLWLNGPHGTDGDYYLDGYVGTDEVIDRLDANPPRCASILASRFAQLHLKIIHLKKSRHEWKRRWAELQGGRVRRGIYIGRSDAEEAWMFAIYNDHSHPQRRPELGGVCYILVPKETP
jgi:hypothetical protein